MDALLNENLITTKDASEFSGYSSDYLSRLARSGKVTGKRIGHSWLIDRKSLSQFIAQQGNRKVDQSRALAHARGEEYRAHHSAVLWATKSLTKIISTSKLYSGRRVSFSESSLFDISPVLPTSSFRSEIAALTIAFLVVSIGVMASRSAFIPQLAEKFAILAQDTASGFAVAFENVPMHIASNFSEMQNVVRSHSQSVASQDESSFNSSPLLSGVNIALPKISGPDISDEKFKGPIPFNMSVQSRSNDVAKSHISLAPLRTFAEGTYTLLTSPSLAASAIVREYDAIGMKAYDAINVSLVTYRSLIESIGAQTFTLALTTRDALSTAPQFISRINLALGSAVINASHAAIDADVALAYGTAAAAPASARLAVAFIGGTGDVLANATSRVPALAVAAFLHVTALPATVAPAIAQSVFDAEYAAATRFVPFAYSISDHYLALVEGAGRTAYVVTDGTLAFVRNTKPVLANMSVAIGDAFEKSSVALSSVISVPQLAAVLEAAAPTLSAGEQFALTTYQTITGIFNSTADALATLFGSSSSTTTPTVVPKAKVAAIATTTKPQAVVAPATTPRASPAAGLSTGSGSPQRGAITTTPIAIGTPPTQPAIGPSYPTYVTTVNGVSQDFVNQSIATMRNNILATVAGQIQPVAAQGVTNMTTIQQVNMIQRLGGLIVDNGVFNGGTFDGGSIANASSISSANGNFGALTVTGAFSSNSSATAPFFAATDPLATSTFAGALTVAGNVGIAGTLLTKDPIADVRSFGATGNGVTDDTAAVQAALAASKNIFFPPGTYIVSNLTIAKDGTNLYGVGPSSVIQMKNGAVGSMINGGSFAINISNLNLYGGDDTSKKTVVASSTNQTAISLHSQLNSSLSHITIHGFGNIGVNITDTTRDRLTHLVFSDSQIYNTFEAFLGGPNNAEYVRLSNLDINNNRYGLYLSSGNMTVTNSKINDNGIAVSVIGTGIGNNAHGNVSNSLINHSAIYSIYTENVTNGFNFIGNNIFEGDIYLATSTGITIGDGIIDVNNYYLQAGGRNYIRNNYIHNGFTNTVQHNFGGSTDKTLFQDNFYDDGTFISNNYSLQAVNGGVGIGTTSPAAMLDITGTSTTPTLGIELISAVADQGFSSDTGHWTGTNWTIGGNVDTHTAGANPLTLSNTALSSAPVSGKVYRILFRLNTTSVGTISMGFGSSGAGLQGGQIPLGQAIGSTDQTQVVAATGAGPLIFTPNATWAGTLTNVFVEEITVAPALGIIRNSNGTIASEFRTGGAGLESLFWGTNAGYTNGIAGVGVFNIGIGQNALAHNLIGIENTVIGARSFVSNTNGNRNTVVGFGGMFSNTTSNDNTSLGAFTLGTATIGGSNTAVGSFAGNAVTTGANNIFLGYHAGDAVTTGSNNIIIGYDIDAPLSTSVGTLNIGNLIFGTGLNGIGNTLSSGNIGIGTTSPYSMLSIANNLNTAANTPLFTIASTTGGTATSTLLTVSAGGQLAVNGAAISGTFAVRVNTGAANSGLQFVGTNPTGGGTLEVSNGAGSGIFDIISSAGSRVFFNGAETDLGNSFGPALRITFTSGNARLSANGTNFPVANAQNFFKANIDTNVGMIIAQNSGTQSADLLQLTDSTGLNILSTFKSNGAFGIGTSSPYAQLSISNSATSAANGTLFTIASTTGGTSTTTLMTVLANGFVGIGKTAPVSALDVTGTVTISSQLIVPTIFASGGGTGIRFNVPSAQDVTIRAGSSDAAFVLKANNNLGIGTTSPYSLLSLSNSATTAANTPLFTIASTTGGTSTTTLLTVLANGNVGIGTTSPTSALTVAGTITPDADLTANLGSATKRMVTVFSVHFNGGGNTTDIITTGGAAGSPININPGGAVNTTFSANGNVGIGTTSPFAQLSISNSATTAANGTLFTIASTTSGLSTSTLVTVLANGSVGIGNAAPLAQMEISDPGTSAGGLRVSRNTAQYIQINENGFNAHVFSGFGSKPLAITNADATAGGVGFEVDINNSTGYTTGTRAFTILNSGNVGIGTTSPYSMLSVAGQIVGLNYVATSTTATSTFAGFIDVNGTGANATSTFAANLWVKGTLRAAVSFVGDLVFSNSFRFIEGDANAPMQNLQLQNQFGSTIVSFDDTGTVSANGFIIPLGSLTSTSTAPFRSDVLTADGKGIDLYKLATFAVSNVQTLAMKMDEQKTRIDSLESRIAKLESGAISTASGSPISLSTTSLASAFNAVGAFISKGFAQFGTLVADQFVAATNSAGTSSAGTVTILAGNTVAQVSNSYVKSTSKIFVTLTASTTGSWYISDKQNGSFKLVLSAPQAADVSFDYFLVQTEGQMATSTPETANSSQQTVNSSDTTPPVITILGDNPVHVSVDGTFTDPGIVVSSGAPYTTFINGIQQEVNATTIDTASPMTYLITYRVIDASGDISTAIRAVIVGNPDGTVSVPSASGTQPVASTDTTPPVVTLAGEAALQLSEGQTFTDPGATAADETDGDLTNHISVSGAVDTATAGLYTLTYTATDAAGNVGSVSRVVTVLVATAGAAATSTAP